MAIIIAIVIIVAIALARCAQRRDKFTLEHTVAIRSTVDGMDYRVHVDMSDPEAAANALAETNAKLITLLRHLKQKYGTEEMKLEYPQRAKAVGALLRRYNPDNLTENSPLDPSGDTSYTLDKGALVALCLRERSKKHNGSSPHNLHDPDTVAFVAIHEMTHMAIDQIDHPKYFWRAFKFLLQEAADIGVLRPIRFDLHPVVYCGMRVDYNPLFDSNTTPIV